MGLFDYFQARRKTSADVAKERLSILITRDRIQRNRPSFLPQLQEELLAVIRKYVDIDQNDVSVTLEREEDCEILELNIALPEKAFQKRETQQDEKPAPAVPEP
jgi:cell division topological specificity factor